MDDRTLTGLLERVGQGDLAAFERLYTEIKTPLYTVLLRVTRDAGLAEDLLQELFLKLFRSPPVPPPRKPRAYLFQLARHLALDGLKKQPHHADIDDYAQFPDSSQTDSAARLDLERAFRALSPEERLLVSLHLNGGLKFREIAAILDRPLGTVLWRYRQAIGKLRILLDGGTV